MAEEAHTGGDTKLHGDEKAKHAGEKKGIGKDGSWIEKHKAIAYGGMAFVLIILFLFLRHSSSSSDTSSGASGTVADGSGATDPATGYLSGSPADIAALTGSGSSGTTPSTGDTTTTNNYYSGTSGSTTSGSTANTPNAVGYSWTDNGQKITLDQLAKELGIPVSQFVGSNALGTKAVGGPNADIAKGAKFDYYTTPGEKTTANASAGKPVYVAGANGTPQSS